MNRKIPKKKEEAGGGLELKQWLGVFVTVKQIDSCVIRSRFHKRTLTTV